MEPLFSPTADQSLIRLSHVSRTYKLSQAVTVTALRDISLDIRAGEFVSITGASGSGKSTLLNLIGLLDTPDEGELLIRGQSVRGLSERELGRLRLSVISFVFQFFNLIDSFTALENIVFQLELQGLGKTAARVKAREILGFLGIEQYADRFPNELSGGEQQRIAIGRSLAKNSELILADEPTAHLDSKNAGHIMTLLRSVNEKFKKTIVLVTHEPIFAQRADRMIVLKDGRIDSEWRPGAV